MIDVFMMLWDVQSISKQQLEGTTWLPFVNTGWHWERRSTWPSHQCETGMIVNTAECFMNLLFFCRKVHLVLSLFFWLVESKMGESRNCYIVKQQLFLSFFFFFRETRFSLITTIITTLRSKFSMASFQHGIWLKTNRMFCMPEEQ